MSYPLVLVRFAAINVFRTAARGFTVCVGACVHVSVMCVHVTCVHAHAMPLYTYVCMHIEIYMGAIQIYSLCGIVVLCVLLAIMCA